MADKLDQLSGQLDGYPERKRPPLHLWHPELSGDIDIVIQRDGSWRHEGAPIRRAALVRLFASILRREDDGEYYLVTPVEKWRITVEVLPLLITDFEIFAPGEAGQALQVRTNTGDWYTVSASYPLYLEAAADKLPAVRLDNGLAALFSRAAWYRLAEVAEETPQGAGLLSSGEFFPIHQ